MNVLGQLSESNEFIEWNDIWQHNELVSMNEIYIHTKTEAERGRILAIKPLIFDIFYEAPRATCFFRLVNFINFSISFYDFIFTIIAWKKKK